MNQRQRYNATYYSKNRNAQLARVRKNKQAVRAVMQYNKHWARCADCKEKYPYWVNQYDHLRDKTNAVSRSWLFGMNTLLQEIDKCDIVCANCHAERTHRRC